MPIERLGPYRILKPLGRGGMGTVYAGVHCATGERAAIKLLSEMLDDDPRFRERFLAEVETLKKLRHENIVSLLGHGEEDGRLFFVMELVDGPSLEAELQAGRRFGWREAASVGVQICAALKHAHDHGVIHRDLKPANLMLDRSGLVKLTDFGIARLFGYSGLTLSGSMIGTPDYMAPEQTEGKPVTPRSDLYSLGSVLYALVAGRPPFGGTSVTQVIDRVRFEPPRPLRKLRSEVPEPFDELLGQLLAKDPDGRPATPQLLSNLLQAMQHALRDDAADAKPSGRAIKPPISSAITVDDTSPPAEDAAELPSTGERATVDFVPPAAAMPPTVATAPPLAAPTAGANRAGSSPTTLEPSVSDRDSASVKTHFTRVTDDDWRRQAVADAPANSRRGREWLAIGGLAMALLAIGVIYVVGLLPLSANRLYERITTVAPGEEPTDQQDEWLNEFLRRFPDDPRCTELQQLQLDWRCRQLWQRLTHRTRRLTDFEVLYIDGMERAEQGETKAARERFEAIIAADTAGKTQPYDRRLVDSARHMLGKVSAPALERPPTVAPAAGPPASGDSPR